MGIGFIGQGFIGKAYADDIESRGFSVIRYARSEPYASNKDRIKDCDIVFIAVPTPTTPDGFDDSVLREVMALVGKGKCAVIKSTVLPGTTEKLQEEFKDIYIVHNPEFLRAKIASEDIKNPHRTIIGLPSKDQEYKKYVDMLLDILPKAPIEIVCSAREAELIKYASNSFLTSKIIYFNLIYDLAEKLGADYDVVRNGVVVDPRIGKSHTDVVHDGGRGAGSFCFIKDFAALRELYERELGDDEDGLAVIKSIEEKNKALLRQSGKDSDLLKGVYGESI